MTGVSKYLMFEVPKTAEGMDPGTRYPKHIGYLHPLGSYDVTRWTAWHPRGYPAAVLKFTAANPMLPPKTAASNQEFQIKTS